jgi:hypothetical protein
MAASYAFRPSAAGEFNPVHVPGSAFSALVEITSAGGDYPTGGYAFGIAQLQTLSGGAYSAITDVDVVNHWVNKAGGGTTAALAAYDRVNNKVQAFGMAAAAGVGTLLTELTANDAALASGFTCTLRVWFY